MQQNIERYVELVNCFKKINILVIGDLMLDVFIYGDVNRVSPEAPVPVVNVKNIRTMPGGASNVAKNLKSLGAEVTLCGVAGRDETGAKLRKILSELGIKSFLLDDGRKTSIKTRIIASNQQVVRYDIEEPKKLSPKYVVLLTEFIEKNITSFDGIILSDYGKGVITPKMVGLVTNIASKYGKIVTVDPKVKNFKSYKNVTCITPNTKEASEGVGIKIKDEKTLFKAARKIQKLLSPVCLLVTRGKDGMSLFDSKLKKDIHIPAVAKEVFDVTGAGDTVISVFTGCLSAGADFSDSAVLSNIAAGIVVGKIGTAVVTPEELINSVQQILGEK